MKKLLTILLALVLTASCFAGCRQNVDSTGGETSAPETSLPGEDSSADPMAGLWEYGEAKEGVYTYQDSVSTLSTSWNRLTYQTTDQAYPLDFMSSGLYSFYFNEDFSGYEIVPEMAAELPIDITAEVKAADTENVYGIPESAEDGYAYKIKLNPDVTFHNGTPITADTWVESMKLMLSPELDNYRGPDYFSGDFSLANAKAYYYGGEVVKDPAYAILGDNLAEADWGKAYFDASYIPAFEEYIFGSGDLQVLQNAGYGKYFLVPTGEVDAEGKPVMKDVLAELMPYYNNPTPVNAEIFGLLKSLFVGEGAPLAAGVSGWGWVDGEIGYFTCIPTEYELTEFEGNVGIYKTGDYEFVIVLDKRLAGFQLLYNLSGSWVVEPNAYKASLSKIEGTEAYASTYGSSVETTYSYGPYMLVNYQTDKFMRFERNTNWWGYKDGKHKYTDPVDGKEYAMYQTDVIETRVVAESTTRKMMFMKGLLMGYGLQAEDYDSLRGSEYAYATPSETIFFFIFNGHFEAINKREAAEDFDTAKYDLQTMTLTSFRKAVAVTYDREKFASTISPSRSGGYGLIGEAYLYDPENGLRYRDTDQAKKALCEFYSVDVNEYESLDEAVDSITGYDPVVAKELFTQAFNEALEEGFITDANQDGKSDQTIRIEYASSASSSFITKTLEYLNAELAKVLVGTPFEGKIEFYESAPYGDDWSEKIRQGASDTVLGGWSGSALNPFGLTDLYVNPDRAYDAAWFDGTNEKLTIKVAPALGAEPVELTFTLKQWSDALNGTVIKGADGTEYCFGDGIADVQTRLDILSAIELRVLQTYNYIPMLQDGSLALLSKQVYYVIEDYNPVMGRGGITYLKYNYDDKAWKEYVESQGGELKY